MFLCDRNRHNWVIITLNVCEVNFTNSANDLQVSGGKLVHFEGEHQFSQMKEQQLVLVGRNKTKRHLLKLFTISPTFEAAFLDAVKLGESLLDKTRAERCQQLLVLNSADEAAMESFDSVDIRSDITSASGPSPAFSKNLLKRSSTPAIEEKSSVPGKHCTINFRRLLIIFP
jgi:hypothetical protein